MKDNRKTYLVSGDNTAINHELRDAQLEEMRKKQGGKIKQAFMAFMRKVEEADRIGGHSM